MRAPGNASLQAGKQVERRVDFRGESEPYMTLAVGRTRRDAGVSAAEVNLKFICDVISQIRVGQRGHGFVVDAKGRLVPETTLTSTGAG